VVILIISASRRTNIPAFFGEWFINRIEDGYFYRINPFNTKQFKKISLHPENVDLFVFWTKYPKPFMKYLDHLNKRGYHYYFQYTVNDYPKAFEPKVPSLSSRVETFQTLSDRIGKEKVIWRYDPIMISRITPFSYHMEKIAALAEKMQGHTNRLMISFLDVYGKIEKRLGLAENDLDIRIKEKSLFKKDLIEFFSKINEITSNRQIQVFTCSESYDFSEIGVKKGSCIDGQMIRSLFQLNKDFPKDRYQRGDCLCAASVDMGVYNTCRYECAYCYAIQSKKKIETQLKKHDKKSPYLIDF